MKAERIGIDAEAFVAMADRLCSDVDEIDGYALEVFAAGVEISEHMSARDRER